MFGNLGNGQRIDLQRPQRLHHRVLRDIGPHRVFIVGAGVQRLGRLRHQVLQQFDGNILGPKILGDATGISSFWVVVAILVGGGFGGVLGMFLGVPVFACLQVLVKYLVDRRLRRRNMPTEAYCYVNRDRESQPPEQQS
mgnify:CR=1 FL=1